MEEAHGEGATPITALAELIKEATSRKGSSAHGRMAALVPRRNSGDVILVNAYVYYSVQQ